MENKLSSWLFIVGKNSPHPDVERKESSRNLQRIKLEMIRKKILEMNRDEFTVNEFLDEIDVSSTTVRKKLKVLVEEGFLGLKVIPQNKYVFYVKK